MKSAQDYVTIDFEDMYDDLVEQQEAVSHKYELYLEARQAFESLEDQIKELVNESEILVDSASDICYDGSSACRQIMREMLDIRNNLF